MKQCTKADKRELSQGGRAELGVGTDIYTQLCTKYQQIINENQLYSTGTLLSALWWPKWEGNLKKRGYMYTYD